MPDDLRHLSPACRSLRVFALPGGAQGVQQFLTLLLKEWMGLARELQHSYVDRLGKSGEGEQELDRRTRSFSSSMRNCCTPYATPGSAKTRRLRHAGGRWRRSSGITGNEPGAAGFASPKFRRVRENRPVGSGINFAASYVHCCRSCP